MTSGSKRVLRVSKEAQPYRTELTPVSFLRRSAYVFPDKTAIVHGERRYTYRQFEERVNRLASGLRGLGLRHLDRVAAILPNTPAMLEAHFGVPAAGLVLVPINTRLSSDEIGYILRHSGAKALFVDQEFEPLVKPLDLGAMTGDPHRRHRRGRRSLRGLPGRRSRRSRASRGSRTSTRRSRSTTPRAPPAAPRASWSTTAAPTSTPSARRIETGMTFESRYLWTLPMFHCNGWCFTWGVTALVGHPRLPAPGRAGPRLGPDRSRGRHPLLRRADRADRHRQRSQGPRARRGR